MNKKNLGFGWMRLPQLSDDPTDIDFEQVNQMVDTYLDAGFTYFDTSFVYHNGTSENAIKKCLVERHPRNQYILASKLPVFSINSEEEVINTFQKQLDNCGVDYFDYFLLHNLNIMHYNTVVKTCHMFEHMKQWKEEGKIKHIAFSFHDSADVLDMILTEHPEVEAVQIALNYLDWESEFIQAKACYEVIRKHNKQVIIMEPIKGGMLATAPKSLQSVIQNKDMPALALRFCGSLDGVLAILSGMSNLKQVQENTACMNDFTPLTNQDEDVIQQIIDAYHQEGPVNDIDFSKYKDIKPNGISLSAILECYQNCMLQPNPGFAAEHNYYSLEKAKHGLTLETPCIPKQNNKLDDIIQKAEDFLIKSAFASYNQKI